MNNTIQVTGYGVTALIAGALIAVFQLELMSDSQRTTLLAQAGSALLVIGVAALQTTVLTVLCSLLGLYLASRVALDTRVRITTPSIWVAVTTATTVAGVIVASDVWICVIHPSDSGCPV